MVLELFEGGSVLISDLKSDIQLKPYLKSEPPAPTYTVTVHLREVHEDVTTVSPLPIDSHELH